ncbi:hypothetical protein [Chachezhania antarctica]|uniref:hypothetical protein n=1 Tax=Chachezhania antarctica TaxID=2340860 RepID=UPI000EAF0F53|nr:hypothetical protein [Chachezhania antarctica]|tara:strand:- start:4055 stop:4438 length:384 start_codon:yes stop_codon:yes gene_type:complete
MKTLAILAATSFLATAAAAEVVSNGVTASDQSETVFEKNSDFLGDAVYDGNGVMIGTVSGASVTETGDHSLLIDFNEELEDEFAGLRFTLDKEWVSGGTLEFTETIEEMRAILAANAAKAEAVDDNS